MATQAERNAATREALRQAALSQLVQFGYAGTNASAICHAAGVTRGALNHQYPDGKVGLIADLVETMFCEQVVHYYKDGYCQPLELVKAMLNALYRDPENEMQLVMMDLWLSMRGDTKLEQVVGPVLYQGTDNLWRCFSPLGQSEVDTLAQLVRTFITGLSVNRLNPNMSAAMARQQIKLMLELIELALTPSAKPMDELASIAEY
ncbi:TetR/AcrR family transcriptional regulator [Motilimonas eburnea]|uniref:TetR/AcrR family transcriptional regulator n=1 Tax=Motilimonas eburnea TaxID=1737488 RepID=UPI001E3C0631|nr:TetR/AcrR family transcriptional regulator [Motilimonas eburnea]MCE2570219.1 TetR/AcrR family transcriptional regulator [Motilimonas eburnea]